MSQDSNDSDNTPLDEVSMKKDIVAERILVDFWQFTEYAKLVLGEDEYKADPEFWSNQFERDYEP